MKGMTEIMNATRAACAAYGNFGKPEKNRNRRGKEWSRARTQEIERLNKQQPVITYRLSAE